MVILAAAVWVSRYGSSEARMFFIAIFAASCFLLATQFDAGARSDFFLNVSTELIGAIILIGLLGDWVVGERWWFIVMFGVVIVNFLLIDMVSGTQQDFFLNIGTELLGAFTIFIMIRREWLWGNDREMRRLQQEREAARLQQAMARRKTRADRLAEDRVRRLREEMQRWKSPGQAGGIQIKITGTSEADVQEKARQLSRVLGNVERSQPRIDKKHNCVYCYLVAATAED